ncbi:hypothetical protein SAMN05443247_04479 [Bradyrhizobium erythrophlei]|nr:hypothetical protein SAMN05443247_04479 [Bradyrhizobium erythrophlei]
MAGIYGEDHENNINALFGPPRIASTAKRFAELASGKSIPGASSRQLCDQLIEVIGRTAPCRTAHRMK